jgi:thiol-disulfide isomerase/thioredoxin
LDTKPWKRIIWVFAAVSALAAPACALAFDLTDIQGKRHRLADYYGRWVVLNFWATWCVPCIQEIPEIALFRREHGEVAVIGVAIDAEDVAKTTQFAAKVGHDYPLVLSDDRVEQQLGPVRALPTTRIYDPSGKIVYDKAGRVDRKLLESAIFSAPRAQRSFHALRTRLG